MTVTSLQATAKAHWQARLNLVFNHKNQKTQLASKQHSGPLMVQKPFYPEKNGCCHVYLIHPPGGIVGGDELHLSAILEKNAHALITTPGASKFYRSNGVVASQKQILHLQDNAILEWLPQETVYFNQASASTLTQIHLSDNSRFLAWEIQCLGMPAQQESFNAGQCLQKFEIWKQQRPVLLETNRIQGGDEIMSAAWGLRHRSALGTFIISDPQQSIDCDNIKQLIETHADIDAAFSMINNIFVIRAMSIYAENIKNFFIAAWQRIRPQVLQLNSSSPRIWHT